jgi:hypothetical protein
MKAANTGMVVLGDYFVSAASHRRTSCQGSDALFTKLNPALWASSCEDGANAVSFCGCHDGAKEGPGRGKFSVLLWNDL